MQWAALALFASLAAMPSTAQARDEGGTFFETTVEIEGSRGFSIDLIVLNGRAHLAIKKGPYFAGYQVAARGFPGIQARFGRLGEVSVDFQRTSRTKSKIRPGCVVEEGVFRGTLRFRGEGGYTSVDLTEAPGRIGRYSERGCQLDPDLPRGSISAASSQSRSVVARRRVGGRTLIFSAFRDGTVAQMPQFFGELKEERRGMTILRSTSAHGGSGSFRVISMTPSRVVVARPPRPFAGSAVFRKRAGARPSWRGSLRVPMLGAGSFRLAGRHFLASLCVKPTSLPGCLYHSVGMPELGR